MAEEEKEIMKFMDFHKAGYTLWVMGWLTIVAGTAYLGTRTIIAGVIAVIAAFLTVSMPYGGDDAGDS